MTEQIRHFYDIDLTFAKNPLTNDILKKVDNNAIKQSIKNLCETKKFDFPFHPEIYSQLRSLLFENFSPITKISIERTLRSLIENYEPRISIIDINVSDDIDKNAIQINMRYRIINATTEETAKFYVYRTR